MTEARTMIAKAVRVRAWLDHYGEQFASAGRRRAFEDAANELIHIEKFLMGKDDAPLR